MNIYYWICAGAAAVLSFGWLALRLRGRGMKPRSAALALPLAVLFGFVVSKLFYVGLMLQKIWMRYGASSLWRMNATEFCFFGGGVGVILAIMLAAKLSGQKTGLYLSAFAPCGALLAAGFRLAEYFQGSLGEGFYMRPSAFTRFPFAIVNKWGEWYFAVCTPAALAALVVAIVFALRKPEDKIPGLRAERTAFYLCVPQIFFESLRSYSLRWGFVRIEQVLCGVVAVGLILYGCLRAKNVRGMKRFWPALCSLVCVAVIVGVEFALDKLNFSIVFWYGVMIVALCGFGALECVCVRRRLREAR